MSTKIAELQERWEAAWPEALKMWGSLFVLPKPTWHLTEQDKLDAGFELAIWGKPTSSWSREPLAEAFEGALGVIRLSDGSVAINLGRITDYGLEDNAPEILAHLIGHHFYVPGNRVDNARLMANILDGLLSTRGGALAGVTANLYADLLVNDRLVRKFGMNMVGVFEKMIARDGPPTQPIWKLYFRAYEVLWDLSPGTLAGADVSPEVNVDAILIARLIRHYHENWVEGGGAFAALLFEYIFGLSSSEIAGAPSIMAMFDCLDAGRGADIPQGLARHTRSEIAGIAHPRRDPRLGGFAQLPTPNAYDVWESGVVDPANPPVDYEGEGNTDARGTYRSLEAYFEVMKSALVYDEIWGHWGNFEAKRRLLVQYYKERARPYIVRFGQDDSGEELARRRCPADLYLGIDSSQAMPSPQHQLSHPILAGMVVLDAALEAGAKIMSVSSSEPKVPGSSSEYWMSDGFGQDEAQHQRVLSIFGGGGYAFGVLRLKETFVDGPRREDPCHILIFTNERFFQMLDETPQGWEIAQAAAQRAGGGATCVLTVSEGADYAAELARLRKVGWVPHLAGETKEMIAIARQFSRTHYLNASRSR